MTEIRLNNLSSIRSPYCYSFHWKWIWLHWKIATHYLQILDFDLSDSDNLMDFYMFKVDTIASQKCLAEHCLDAEEIKSCRE